MVQKWVKLRVLFPALLAVGFAIVSYALIATAPETKRKKTDYVAPLVEVMELKTASHDIVVEAQGLVGAAGQEVELRPQVGGRIEAVHTNFTPGALIPAGETILQIEIADYEIALREAAANLARAKASVALEKGQQQIAREEYELLGDDFDFDENSKSLALREPQLKQFEAEEAIAQNAYDRAKLAMERTRVTLPYDALVLNTSAAVGGVASAGAAAGTFARADKFWVELRVQQKHLGRLKAKKGAIGGSSVQIKSNGFTYEGELVALRANLVASTRMGGAIVEVQNANYTAPNSEKPPLIIGSHVNALIEAGTIEGALTIPRSALLDNSLLYVVDGEQRLQQREATVLWELPESLIVKPNFESRDSLVVSRVSGVAPGTEVRTRFPTEIFAGDEAKKKPAADKEISGR